MARSERRENGQNDWPARDLRALGQAARYPAAPDVSARVRRRIVGAAAWRRSPAWLRPALALAVLVVAGRILAATPAGETLARWFGVGRVKVVQDDATPVPPSERALAGATSLEEARRQAGFPVSLPIYPPDLGGPDQVYAQALQDESDRQVVLRYFSRPSLPSAEGKPLFTLYQFRTGGVFEKVVFSGTRLEEVSVGGAKGFWIEGALHYLRFLNADGTEVAGLYRAVEGNTLVWESEGTTYRLETGLPLEEARKIAESLR